MELETGVIY